MNSYNSNLNIDFASSAFKIEDYCQKITSDFDNWLVTEYKSANEALYGILARCYALSLAYAGDAVVKKKVEDRLTEMGVQNRSNPNPHGRVLNLVFYGSQYIKRRSAYSKALTKAQAENIEAKDLTTWLSGHKGGLEAMRDTTRKSKKELEAEKAEYQTKGCNAVITHKVASQTVITDLSFDKAVSGVLVLVCKVDGASVTPVAVVDDDKPIDAVLKWASEKLAA